MPLTKPKRSKVEGLDAELYVRELSALELVDLHDLCLDYDKKPFVERMTVMAKICAMACCNAHGVPVFDSPEDALHEPFSTLDACAEAVLAASGGSPAPKA